MRRLWPAVFALVACATTGTKFDPAKADQLRPQVSTRADAIELLGKPANETFLADSTTILLWMHSTGTAWGSGKSGYLSALFDKHGKLVRVLQRGGTNLKTSL